MPAKARGIFNTSTIRPVKGIRLSVSGNKRYFVNQFGEPFFYCANTAWTLFKRLDHDEADMYFKNCVSKGFNVIQAYVLRGLNVSNLYGDLPLVGRDPARLNEGFFRNVDYLVDRANEMGLVMGLVTTMGEHVRKKGNTGERYGSDEQIFNMANAFEYGRLLGSRYINNCVIWFLGGDRTPTQDMDIWNAMGLGLKEGSQGTHMVSYHGPGNQDTPSSSYWFHDAKWLDFNVLQSGHHWASSNYRFIKHDYELVPVKPTFDMEPRYEDIPNFCADVNLRMDAHQSREGAYWAVLAGAAGHTYGNNNIWQFHDASKTASINDYTFPLLPPTKNWQEAIDDEGAFGVGHMHKLMELRPWYRMVPDQSVIASGQEVFGKEDHKQAARVEDGSFLLAYLPFGASVGINMDSLSGKKVKAQWYNPREGTFAYIGEFENAGVQEFIAPTKGGNDDWVLVLEDPGKNYPVELP